MSKKSNGPRHMHVVSSTQSPTPTGFKAKQSAGSGASTSFQYPKKRVTKNPKTGNNKNMPDPNDTYSKKTIETMFELHQERYSRQIDNALAEIRASFGNVQGEIQGLTNEVANAETRLSGHIDRHEAVLATHMNWVIGVVAALVISIVGGLAVNYIQGLQKAPDSQAAERPAITQPVAKGNLNGSK